MILPDLREVVHVVAHCHKQVKKQLATNLHFHLHGPASLESLATSDDESQVMSAQSRLRVRRVVIRVPSRSQDHVGRDSDLKALLAERNALQLFQAVLLGCTVDHRVSEYNASHTRMEESRPARPAATTVVGILRVLKVPRVSALAMQQAWVIIALVEELKNAR